MDQGDLYMEGNGGIDIGAVGAKGKAKDPVGTKQEDVRR